MALKRADKPKRGEQGGPGGPGAMPGNRRPRNVEDVHKNRERIIAAMMAGALGGDGMCGLVCLMLTGDLPVEQIVTAAAETLRL